MVFKTTAALPLTPGSGVSRSEELVIESGRYFFFYQTPPTFVPHGHEWLGCAKVALVCRGVHGAEYSESMVPSASALYLDTMIEMFYVLTSVSRYMNYPNIKVLQGYRYELETIIQSD